MKIQIVCSILGILCGSPAQADEADHTFAAYDNRPCGESGSMSGGGTQYKAIDAERPGRCKWVPDEEANRRMVEMDRHREELWWALRSRPLTDTEMAEVKQMGIHLTVADGVAYLEEEKMRELNDALFQQYRLQAEAARNRP
jgi:hypothetical protein